MSLIICICDYWQNRQYFQFHLNAPALTETITPKLFRQAQSNNWTSKTIALPLKRLCYIIDGITAFYLIRELQHFCGLRKWLLTNPALRGLQLFWIEIVPPNKDILDYKWNRMVQRSLWEHIETEHLMSWLSTLGGGYSALGEQFSTCAETAGKISLKQLTIGITLGDPFLQARCKLFFSISLIQQGRLRAAKHIIRKQYEFAKQHKETDKRLVKMCLGIWFRLQYEYGLRLEAKRKNKLIGAGDFRFTQLR